MWTSLYFECETESHDPGIIHRDCCGDVAAREDITVGMNLKEIIHKPHWEGMRGYFPPVWVDEIREDGITVHVGQAGATQTIPEGKMVHLIEFGLSYAVGNIYVKLLTPDQECPDRD